MKTGAVIAAAKYTERDRNLSAGGIADVMSGPERIAATLKKCDIKDIVVVTGYNSTELRKKMRKFGICFVENPQYDSADFMESVKKGLECIYRQCDRIVYCPSGFPFFSEDTVKELLKEDADIVIPVYKGKRGHPIVINSGIVEDILSYNGDGGLRAAYAAVTDNIKTVRVEDKACVSGKSNEEELIKLAEEQNKRLIRAEVDISLTGERKIFSGEIKQLLIQTDKLRSVREACERTGISYSKAWNLIGDSEKELGIKLINRQQGGKNGGTACLSEEGRMILGLYKEFEETVERFAEKEYEKVFRSLLPEMRERK